MDKLALLEKLDDVLRYMNSNWANGANTDGDLYSGFMNQIEESIEAQLFLRFLNKLVEDKFVKKESRQISAEPSYLQFMAPTVQKDYFVIKDYYSITFDGQVFIEQGGYIQRSINEQAENTRLDKIENNQKFHRRWMTALTAILAAGTLIAAIYYLHELLKGT
jgi:hypothetical protein